MACCLEVAVQALFKRHVYQFAGVIYKQSNGGPTGMSSVVEIAEIRMADWFQKTMEILTKSAIRVWLSMIYVDDGRWLNEGTGLLKAFSKLLGLQRCIFML